MRSEFINSEAIISLRYIMHDKLELKINKLISFYYKSGFQKVKIFFLENFLKNFLLIKIFIIISNKYIIPNDFCLAY